MSNEKISCGSLRENYETMLRAVAATAQDFETLLKEVHEEANIAKNGYEQKVFQILRERADSELLSIALID